MKNISFTLNGIKREFFLSDINESLLDLLRRSGFKGTKWGCGEASCGTCTVIVDGKAVYSCVLKAFQADGKDVWTIEGMGTHNSPHPIQKALIDEGAVQCGYCIPGMVISAKAMFDENSDVNDDTIRQYLDGNLCRCTGYEKIYSALLKVADSKSREV